MLQQRDSIPWGSYLSAKVGLIGMKMTGSGVSSTEEVVELVSQSGAVPGLENRKIKLILLIYEFKYSSQNCQVD